MRFAYDRSKWHSESAQREIRQNEPAERRLGQIRRSGSAKTGRVEEKERTGLGLNWIRPIMSYAWRAQQVLEHFRVFPEKQGFAVWGHDDMSGGEKKAPVARSE